MKLTDPDPFYHSLRQKEKKLAVGTDSTGRDIIMFGVEADYPMEDGEKCMAIVVGLPVEYITNMLGMQEF